MTSTVARLACAAGMEDPGRVADDAGRRPDPEVPERARRRTFTAKYKLEVLADYDAAPEGEKGAVLRREGLYSSHIVQWRKARDAGALAGWPPRAAASGVMRRPSRSPGCKARSSDWSRSWPRPAPWWMSRQNFTRSWRFSGSADTETEVEEMTDQAVIELTPQLGLRGACEVIGVSQAGYRRHRQSPAPPRPEPSRIAHRQRHQPRALSTAEQQTILQVLHSDRFADLAPAEVWATLLDEGVYLGSESTFYRLLRRAGGCVSAAAKPPSSEGETRAHRQCPP